MNNKSNIKYQLQYRNINNNNNKKDTNNEILLNIFLIKILNLLALILKNENINHYLIQNKKFL